MKTTNDVLKKQLESSEIINDDGRGRWWLSFCKTNWPAAVRKNGYHFLGVAIVEADGFMQAIKKTWDLQINPGGEVKGWMVENVPSEYHDRLLSRREDLGIEDAGLC